MMLSFETLTRFYRIHWQSDLFGQIDIICEWGGKLNYRRGQKRYCFKTELEAQQHIYQICRKRFRRGYQMTEQS